MNNVTALSKAPGNGVEEPEEQGEETAHVEGARWAWTNGCGVLASNEEKVVSDEEQGETAKDEVSPLTTLSARNAGRAMDETLPCSSREQGHRRGR